MRAPSLVLAFAGVVACATRLDLPPSAVIACESSADCPDDWLCASEARRCVATAAADVDGPSLLAVLAENPTQVILSFDKELAASRAEQVTAYRIDGAAVGLAVSSATLLEDGQRVRLVTAPQSVAASYVAHADGVTDIWGNPPIVGSGAFTGFGVGADPSPPDPLSPRFGERVFTEEVALVWSPRLLARTYTVDVALDSGFTTPAIPSIVITAEDEFTPPPTSVVVQLAPALRYHWRVRADVTTPEQYGVSHFDRMDDGIYVFCDADETCDDALAAGNVSEPVRSIRTGVMLAFVFGLRVVRIARRPGDAPYPGTVQLLDGVSLLGGYDASFGARDLVAERPTIVGAAGVSVVASDLSEPVLLEGLRIVGPNEDIGSSVGLLVTNTRDNLTVRACEVRGGDIRATIAPGARTFGVQILSPADDDSHTPLFEDSMLVGGGILEPAGPFNKDSAGVYTERSTPTLRGNDLIAGGTGSSTSTGIWMNSGAIDLELNDTIQSGRAALSRGLWLSGRRATITGNTTISGATGVTLVGQSLGLEANVTTLTLTDNGVVRAADAALIVGASPSLKAVYLIGAGSCVADIARTAISGGSLTLDPSFALSTKLESIGVHVSNCTTRIADATIRTADVPSGASYVAATHAGVILASGRLELTTVDIAVPGGGVPAPRDAGEVLELYGLTMNWRPNGQSSPTLSDFTAPAVNASATSIVLGDPDNPAQNDAVSVAHGVHGAARYTSGTGPSHTFDTLDLTLAAMSTAAERIGIFLETADGSLSRSRVELRGSTTGPSEAMRLVLPAMTFPPAASALNFKISNSSLYGGSSSATSTALRAPTGTPYSAGWTLLAANSTLVAGVAPDAAALRLDAADGTENTLHLANNLFVTLGAAGTTCLRLSSGALTGAVDELRANAFVECAEAACDGAACMDAAGLNTGDGDGGAFDANLDALLLDAGFASVADPTDFSLSSTSRESLCAGGVDLSTAGLCTATPARCLVVTTDLPGESRTNPPAIGAYERDGCVP